MYYQNLYLSKGDAYAGSFHISGAGYGGRLHFFAGGYNYMMRSEKRRRGAQGGASPDGRPPKRRRRRRAGFFYKFITLLLLLALWPVGLILLWRRRLRWSALTKLATSLVTLVACVVLIGLRSPSTPETRATPPCRMRSTTSSIAPPTRWCI